MQTITITPTQWTTLRVTGAAARSVRAAEQAADALIADARRAAERMSAVLNAAPNEVDATWLAGAWKASSDWNGHLSRLCSLSGRYETHFDHSLPWPVGGGIYRRTEETVAYCGVQYRELLVSAGIPMAPLPAYAEMVTYWEDAAARGC